MSLDKIKSVLKEKIDSFDAYKQAVAKIGGDRYYETYAIWDIQSIGFTPDDTPYGEFNGEYVGEVASRAKEHTFWWFREQARIAVLYPPRTNVMQRLIKQFKLGAYCIHPSTDPAAPEAVTYTPDQAMGIADRQVKLSSLGKLIRKLCPLVSDAHAQKLEAMHRAELDPSFLIASTAEEIAYVYQHMEGDSGCMRYDNSRWGLPRGMHPSQVYAADNMGVAYHKVGDAIKSRAVIWTDANGNKKYLRLYGDGALKRKLEANGYTQGSLAGARIKAIRLAAEHDSSERYVVPYIDGQGGAQSDEDGTWGYIPANDPSHIQLVTRAVANRLNQMGYGLTRFKAHSDVRHFINTIDTADFTSTCPITGLTVDQLVTQGIYVYHDGEVKLAHSSAVEHGYSASVSAHRDSRWIDVYFTTDNPPPTFNGTQFDDAQTRRAMGHVLLSEPHYAALTWARKADVIHQHDADGNVIRILKADALRVTDADGEKTIVHTAVKTQAAYKKEGYVSVPPRDGIRWLVHKDNPYLVQLMSGKWALRNEHAIEKLYDGRWAPARSVEPVTLYGVRFNKLKDLPLDPDFVPAEEIQSRILRGYSCTSAVADSFISGYGAEASVRINRAFDSEVARTLCYGERIVPDIRESNGTAVLTYTSYWNGHGIENVIATLARIDAVGFDRDAFAEVHGQRAAQAVNRWIVVARLFATLQSEMQARVSEVLNANETTVETANV